MTITMTDIAPRVRVNGTDMFSCEAVLDREDPDLVQVACFHADVKPGDRIDIWAYWGLGFHGRPSYDVYPAVVEHVDGFNAVVRVDSSAVEHKWG